ncbi:hypothetical protein DERP_002859 [Dermatophagoides pteronyssinus]|uniref:Uncharacterized protein n=1 Tax=Dermatophagoides pteronyssinus TaxID=6956 RepID=A0ABQ8JVU6_DERPT|nr:hypothetical protein DERP_002859 [Dermatophagoides pteronyssinus]
MATIDYSLKYLFVFIKGKELDIDSYGQFVHLIFYPDMTTTTHTSYLMDKLRINDQMKHKPPPSISKQTQIQNVNT